MRSRTFQGTPCLSRVGGVNRRKSLLGGRTVATFISMTRSRITRHAAVAEEVAAGPRPFVSMWVRLAVVGTDGGLADRTASAKPLGSPFPASQALPGGALTLKAVSAASTLESTYSGVIGS